MIRRPSPASTRVAPPAVARLAWITDDVDAVLLLRRRLLEGVVRQGHKAMVLSPSLSQRQHLELLAAGIEGAAVPRPAGLRNPFTRHAARRRLAGLLAEWGATAVLVDSEACAAWVCDATSKGCNWPLFALIRPVETSADGGAALPKPWLSVLPSAAAIFAATAADVRSIAARFEHHPPPIYVLPPATVDLAAVASQPLPALTDGLVVLGARAPLSADTPSTRSIFPAAAGQLEGRAGRARFRLADFAATASNTGAALAPAIERVPLEITDAPAIHATIAGAHVVVIDGATPIHLALLAAALAIGRPVLCTDMACTRDLVAAGSDGWCIPVANPTAMAEALAAILKRPDLLPAMARAARTKAERRLGHHHAQTTLFQALRLAPLRTVAA